MREHTTFAAIARAIVAEGWDAARFVGPHGHAVVRAPRRLAVGKRVYERAGALGAGAFGAVFAYRRAPLACGRARERGLALKVPYGDPKTAEPVVESEQLVRNGARVVPCAKLKGMTIMPEMDGTLNDLVLTRAEKWSAWLETLDALQDLWYRGHGYLDLKQANVLVKVDARGELRAALGDLGGAAPVGGVAHAQCPPPEYHARACDVPVNERTVAYAAGAFLAKMLAPGVPVRSWNEKVTKPEHLENALRDLEDTWLARVLRAALLARRPLEELLALSRWGEHERPPVPPATPPRVVQDT